MIVGVDFLFLSVLALSIAMTGLAFTKFISENNNAPSLYTSGADSSRTTIPLPQSADNQASTTSESAGQYSGGSDELSPSGEQVKVTTSDSDLNDANRDPESSEALPLAPAGQLVREGASVASQSSYSQQDNIDGDLGSQFYSPIYESSSYILPITWGAVAGTLMWRGKVRSAWCKQGYDYDTFRLMARMKGSPIRVKLLSNVATAKNRLQLAKELNVDWKTIDNHIELLARNGLIEEKTIVGTYRYYVITEHGRRILALLSALDNGRRIAEAEPALN